jgi:hypothetical protein
MREIRQSGSEGGGAGNSTGSPYPYYALALSGRTNPPTEDVCNSMVFNPGNRGSSLRGSRKEGSHTLEF